MGIKAIETRFKGYRFRSRLEARYAVFFDALNIKWEYEKEGYDLGNLGYYLPDFWLPKPKLWIEIKGSDPTQEEQDKVFELCRMTKCSAYLCVGEPQVDNIMGAFWNGIEFDWHSLDKPISGDWLKAAFQDDDPKKWAEILKDEGAIFRQFGPIPFRQFYGDSDTPVLKAISAFRSARFENGENG